MKWRKTIWKFTFDFGTAAIVRVILKEECHQEGSQHFPQTFEPLTSCLLLLKSRRPYRVSSALDNEIWKNSSRFLWKYATMDMKHTYSH